VQAVGLQSLWPAWAFSSEGEGSFYSETPSSIFDGSRRMQASVEGQADPARMVWPQERWGSLA